MEETEINLAYRLGKAEERLALIRFIVFQPGEYLSHDNLELIRTIVSLKDPIVSEPQNEI